jgi:hypothetical protein
MGCCSTGCWELCSLCSQLAGEERAQAEAGGQGYRLFQWQLFLYIALCGVAAQ